MSSFFSDNRKQFFRPLTSKYREQFVECLKRLYLQFFSIEVESHQNISREQIVLIFQEVLRNTPVFVDEADSDEWNIASRSVREQAIWILNTLLEYGWLDRHVDEASMQTSFVFTSTGRQFAQPMLESSRNQFRTRHRNTRNTRNALQSFIEKGEVYDLLDAYEFSERIISDFTDVITELDEKKRHLVREVETWQLIRNASDEFFEFMEKRFMPDLAVRLSADSVEKYRDEIQILIKKIKRKSRSFKADAEIELRKVAPELLVASDQSLLMMILDGIDSRMNNASEIMLPALRHALYSFTRRADIIIRQLSYSSGVVRNDLLPVCESLKKLSTQEQDSRLLKAGEILSGLNFSLPDSSALTLFAERKRRVVKNSLEENLSVDKETRKSLFIQQVMDTAFSVSHQELLNHISNAIRQQNRVSSHTLPISNARELLMVAHAIEVGANGVSSSEFEFRILPNGEQFETEYYQQTDGFTIELVER